MGWTYMIHFLIIMSQSTKIVMGLRKLGLAQDCLWLGLLWRVLHFEKLPFLIQTKGVNIRGSSQLGLEFF